MEPRWLSPRTAAAYIDVSIGTLYEYASDGTLPGVRRFQRRNSTGVGRHKVTIRIDRLAIDKWLEGRGSSKPKSLTKGSSR